MLEHEIGARLLTVPELLELAAAPPPGLELGDSARVLFALVELAQRSVSEGMVHPQLTRGGEPGTRSGARRSTITSSARSPRSRRRCRSSARRASTTIARRRSAISIPQLVDQVARDRLVAAGVRLGDPTRRGRQAVVEAFLAGLCSPDPELPPNSSYAALERRLTRWVDEGLAELKETTWRLGLQLDERPRNGLALELWLHADDDATLSLPVSLLWEGGDDAFAFVRSGDPAGDLERDLAVLRPAARDRGDRVRGRAAVRGRARRRDGDVLPARPDAEARAARTCA